MSETTQQAVSTKAEGEPQDFILTKTGVMIVGSELIGDKLTALLCEAIEMNKASGLASVVIRNDGYPRDADGPVFAMTYADTHSFAINLNHCWDRACEIATEGDKYLSFLGVLWINVLSCFGHELDHLDLAAGDRELYEALRANEEGNKELETAAKETAQTLIMRLALKFDTEIPAPAELGWFGVKWMELHTNEESKDLEWVIKARQMVESGVVYEEPDNDIKITSFREFVKQGYDLKGKEDWDQAVSCVNLEAHLDAGVEEFKAEPVEAPEIETVELEISAEQEAIEAVEMGGEMPEAAEVQAGTLQAAAMFVGAGNAEMPAVEPIAEAPTTTVPLPGPVAAVQAQLQAAAKTATPPAPHSEPTYTPNNLSNEIISQVMEQVWRTCYHHIFTKCGWQQNPQTGRFFFANAAAVLEGINIQHIIQHYGADNLIMEYLAINGSGQEVLEKCQGMLRGTTTSRQGLPCYTLFLNLGGKRFKRTFVAQNPDKLNAQNAYTKTAAEAGEGHMLAWVYRGEADDSAPFKEKCAVKIRDNNYEVF